MNYGRPENDGDLQDDFMNVCSTEFKKDSNISVIPTISVELPTLDRRLRCFGIRYINYDTPIQEVEDAVQKEIDGPWRHLGYKGQIIPEMITRRLGQKSITENYLLNSSTDVALRKAPLSNSFSSITAFSVKKLTHSEFWIWTVPVPNQLPSLHLFSDWCGKVSVSNKNCR